MQDRLCLIRNYHHERVSKAEQENVALKARQRENALEAELLLASRGDLRIRELVNLIKNGLVGETGAKGKREQSLWA